LEEEHTVEYPTFNYKNPYLLMISIFGIVFILTLTGTIVISNPINIVIASSIVIFLNIIAWIIDEKLTSDLDVKKKWG
jgi:hypothetical protein